MNQQRTSEDEKPPYQGPRLDWEDGKVRRKFTKEWATSGSVEIDKIPAYVKSIVVQRKSMVTYIELLHDKIDELSKEEKNLKTQEKGYSLEEWILTFEKWSKYLTDYYIKVGAINANPLDYPTWLREQEAAGRIDNLLSKK